VRLHTRIVVANRVRVRHLSIFQEHASGKIVGTQRGVGEKEIQSYTICIHLDTRVGLAYCVRLVVAYGA
jgi:hypothetical protein